MARPNHNCSKACSSSSHNCHRIGRFNGDDCLFCGDKAFFLRWREVTSRFGLIVQEEKTGVSSRFGELNSECFDYSHGTFIPKSFFSFLRPNRQTGGDLMGEIIAGSALMKDSTKLWLINHVMRYEIIIRGLTASTIPNSLAIPLLKRRWVRKLIVSPPPPFPSSGTDRSIPVVVAPAPTADYLEIVNQIDKEVIRAHVKYWHGRQVVSRTVPIFRDGHIYTDSQHWLNPVCGENKCRTFRHSTAYDATVTPLRTHLPRKERRNIKREFDLSSPPPPSIRYRRNRRWAFSYLRTTFDMMKKFFGERFMSSDDQIHPRYEHPSLCRKDSIENCTPPVFYPPPLSIRVPLLTLDQHAQRIYGLPTYTTVVLTNSKTTTWVDLPEEGQAEVYRGRENRLNGLYKGFKVPQWIH